MQKGLNKWIGIVYLLARIEVSFNCTVNTDQRYLFKVFQLRSVRYGFATTQVTVTNLINAVQ